MNNLPSNTNKRNKFEQELYMRETGSENYEASQKNEIEEMVLQLVETSLTGFSEPEVEVKKFQKVLEEIRIQLQESIDNTHCAIRATVRVNLCFPKEWFNALLKTLKDKGYESAMAHVGDSTKIIDLIIAKREEREKDGMETDNEGGNN